MRRRSRGQAMVEFGLCAPLLFGVFFAVVNGGLFMFAKSSVARATNVGTITEAAEGSAPSADVDTLAAMRKAGLGPSALVGVQWIQVEEVTYSASQGYQTVTGCTLADSTSVNCINQYAADGSPMWPASSLPNCTDATFHCPPWPASARSTHVSSASVIRLTVHYTFTFPATGKSFTLDEVNIFRLEPKDL
jgi:Flp pilus assembly protein TadG